MRYRFLLNPAAGKGEALRLGPRAAAAFREGGRDCALYITAGPGDEARYIREELSRAPGEETVFFACGGDGTVREAAQGLRDRKGGILGILPCGSGNDLVKSFPGRDFTDLPAQLAGEAAPMDLIDFCGRTVVNLGNCGLDADVAHNMPLFRRWPGVSGSMAYKLSIPYTFFRPLGKRGVVRLDGGPEEERELLLLVCGNGQYYGGGFRGAPLAKPDDGLLDVCMIPMLGRGKLLSMIGRYQKGRHVWDEDLRALVTYRQVRRVEARFAEPVTLCADGETFRGEELTARVLPGAVRLWRPAQDKHKVKTGPGKV